MHPNVSSGKRSIITLVLTFLATSVPLGVQSWLFWPGKFTYDSIQQLRQGLGLEAITDHHPISMALLMNLFASTETGKFYYLILQMILVALCSSLSVFIVQRTYFSKLSLRSAAIFCSVLSFILVSLPPTGLLDSIIWKDIPFTWLLVLQATAVTAMAYNSQMRESHFLRNLNFLLIVEVVAGSLAFHFRHNALSVSGPLLVASFALYFWRLGANWRLGVRWVVVSFFFALLVFGARVAVKSAYDLDSKSSDDWWVNEILHPICGTDFFLALKKGMPIDASLRSQIDEFVDIDQTIKLADPGNAIPVRYRDQRQPDRFVKLAFEALSDHPVYWLRAKLSYLWLMIFSRGGYQVPLGTYDDFSKENLPVNINMDIDTQPLRVKYRYWMGYDTDNVSAGVSPIVKLFAWTFIPALMILFLCFVVGAYSAVSAIRLKKYPKYLDLLVFPLTGIALSIPIALLSQANDFRYFWPNTIMAQVAVVILLFHGIRAFGRAKAF